MKKKRKNMEIRIWGKRGFWEGVEREIKIVVMEIKKYGEKVYVRNEIVKNSYVVEGIKERGEILVEEMDEIKEEKRKKKVVF